MFPLSVYIKEIIKLDPSIISLEGRNIVYRGQTLSFIDYYVNPSVTLEQILNTSLRFSTEESIRINQKYFTSYSSNTALRTILEHIYLQECKKPYVFFKNGTIKKTIITALLETQEDSRKAKYPVMRYIISKIEEKWDSIPVDQKNKIDFLFYNDVFDPKSSFYFLEKSGTLSEISDHKSKYYPANPFLRQVSGLYPIYIEKHSIAVFSINTENQPGLLAYGITSPTLSFTEEEFTWFTSQFTQCSCCHTWQQKCDIVLGQCSSCFNCDALTLETYSAKATSKFEEAIGKSHKYSPHLFGVELEYENKRNTNLKEVLLLLNKTIGTHAIFKRDGSLDNGIEICTRPASIDIHLEELKKFYDEQLLWDRIEVKPTCGMHVHIDKRKMTALTLGKLINFVQKKSNQPLIELIAERASNRFSELGTELSVTSFHRGAIPNTRYLGINTTNPHTAELRIFKTPSTHLSFEKNMEFVSALTSFVQPCNSGIKDTTSDSFIHFLNKNKSTYKTLSSFLKGSV